MNQTLLEQYVEVMSTNLLYQRNQDHWEYLLNSYMGGVEYQRGQYLTRYVNETEREYSARIAATHLENHCRSVISTYISFLFREAPTRDFDKNSESFELEMFLRDADMDGRSFDAFMKEVSVWASVFGHCWVLVVKPSVGAVTRSDESLLNVRPYVNLVTPLTVTDWNWNRKPNGEFELTYFKYIEESNGILQTYRRTSSTFLWTMLTRNWWI